MFLTRTCRLVGTVSGESTKTVSAAVLEAQIHASSDGRVLWPIRPKCTLQGVNRSFRRWQDQSPKHSTTTKSSSDLDDNASEIFFIHGQSQTAAVTWFMRYCDKSPLSGLRARSITAVRITNVVHSNIFRGGYMALFMFYVSGAR